MGICSVQSLLTLPPLLRLVDPDTLAEEIQEKSAAEIKKYYKVFKKEWKTLAGTFCLGVSLLFFNHPDTFLQKHHESKLVLQKVKPNGTSGLTLNIYSPRKLLLSGILCKSWSSTIPRQKAKFIVKKRIDIFFADSGIMACIWMMFMNVSRRISQSSLSFDLIGSSRVDRLRNCRGDVIPCWG